MGKRGEKERDRRNVTIGKINDKCTWNMLYHIYKCVLHVPSLYMRICIYVYVYVYMYICVLIRIYMYIRADLYAYTYIYICLARLVIAEMNNQIGREKEDR